MEGLLKLVACDIGSLFSTMPSMNIRTLTDRLAIWIATGFGVGLISPAPGTIGGLWGLPLVWLIGQMSPAAQGPTIAILVLASVAICSAAAQALGGSKDPQAIVLDEIVALPIVFLGTGSKSPAVWIVGFLLFRLFDISKPPPARQVEHLHSGWGIVADDCVAAGYAWLALQGILWAYGASELGWLSTAA